MNPVLRFLGRGLCLIFLSLASGRSVLAQSTNTPAGPSVDRARPLNHRAHGFRIYADTQSDAQLLYGLTADVFDEIQARLKLPLERPAGIVLSIVAQEQGAANGRNVSFAQRKVGAQLSQRIWIWDLNSMDPEDFLEACSWAVLNRYIDARTAPGKVPEFVPDWFAVGMAQAVYQPVKMRNNRVILDLLEGPRFPVLDEVLTWEYLPEGRWGEKAVCGLLMKWLVTFPAKSDRFSGLLDQIADGDGSDIDLITGFLPGFAGKKEARTQWTHWVTSQRRRILVPGTLTLGAFDEVRTLYAVDRNQTMAPTNGVPAKMVLEDLIVRRESEWVKPLCVQRSNAFAVLGIARGGAFKRVMASYSGYLIGLSGAKSSAELEAMLVRAHKELADLEQLTRARRAYMDGVERSLGFVSGEEMRRWFWEQGSRGRTVSQKYIDHYERQF